MREGVRGSWWNDMTARPGNSHCVKGKRIISGVIMGLSHQCLLFCLVYLSINTHSTFAAFKEWKGKFYYTGIWINTDICKADSSVVIKDSKFTLYSCWLTGLSGWTRRCYRNLFMHRAIVFKLEYYIFCLIVNFSLTRLAYVDLLLNHQFIIGISPIE